MSKRRENDSSMFMPSAKRKPRKTALTPAKPETLPTKSSEAQVLSRPSPSPLAEIYKTEQFQNESANDLKFHVAQNLLHLRRARGLSQEELALAVGTSQPAIAQIESGQKNLTIDTLERIIVALRGRLLFATPPQERALTPLRPWWETKHTAGDPWSERCRISWTTDQTERMVIGLERDHEQALSPDTLPNAKGSTLPNINMLVAAASTGAYYGQKTSPKRR
jgi:transcriptional regulator with XRE-family HTH domain